MTISSSSSSSSSGRIDLFYGGLFIIPKGDTTTYGFRLSVSDGQYARVNVNGVEYSVASQLGKLVWDPNNVKSAKHVFSVVGENHSIFPDNKEYIIRYRGVGSLLFDIWFSSELSSSSSISTEFRTTSSSISSSSISSSSSSTKRFSSSLSSSSSTQIMSSSSSSSSCSSSSSSSSFGEGYSTLRCTFEGVFRSPVWSFTSHNGYIYAGTGPNGVILRSSDLVQWDNFNTVEDCHVRSLFIWANALFAGTEPLGRIYVHNFSSGRFYNIVQTEDHAVTSFAEFNGKLYAATSPYGVIYSFDGAKWIKECKCYGNGVNQMIVHEGLLYVTLSNTETVIVFDGNKWKILNITNPFLGNEFPVAKPEEILQNQTITSSRNITKPPFSFDDFSFLDTSRIMSASEDIDAGSLTEVDRLAITPSRPETGVMSTASDSMMGLLLGSKNGSVYAYDSGSSGSLSRVLAKDGGFVNAIQNVGGGKNVVAIDNKLYILKEMLT